MCRRVVTKLLQHERESERKKEINNKVTGKMNTIIQKYKSQRLLFSNNYVYFTNHCASKDRTQVFTETVR